MKRLILNRIKTPDGTILTSYTSHDYVTHLDENGEVYMLDGGIDYQRTSVNKEPFEDLSVYEDAPFEIVRKSFHRGGRGINGDQPLTWTPMCDMTDEWLEACIYIYEERGMGESFASGLYKQELKYRNNLKNKTTMNTQLTLFARYKRMINKLWDQGHRIYTSDELNKYVGAFENPTRWKGFRNQYYTTRTYQTRLKHLGCITMIKRGIWRINGPVPEWFSSFHFTGLKGGFDENNKYADHNCIYWKSLPTWHRVNPWIEVLNERKRVRENAQAIKTEVPELAKREEEIKTTIIKDEHMNVSQAVPIAVMLGVDQSKTIVEDSCVSTNVTFNVTAPFGVQFQCISWVNKQLSKDGTWEIEVIETELSILANPSVDYKAVKNTIHLMMGEEAGDAWIDSLDVYAREAVEKQSIVVIEPVISTSDVKTYTEDQVNHILKEFTMYMLADFKSTVQDVCNNLSDDELVEFSIDYDRRIDVSFDTDAIAREIKDNLNDQADMSLRDFSISTVNFE